MKKLIDYLLIMSIFLIVIAQTFFVTPTKVLASEKSSLIYEELTIYVMPQYATPEEWEADQPAVLVGIHGTLINESDMSYKEEIRIPLPYDEPDFQFFQAGEFMEDGSVQDTGATLEENSGEALWQPEHAIEPGEAYNFVTEYYFALTQDGISYEFSFMHALERDTNKMNILFFEPYDAEGYTVNSEYDASEETDAYGISAHLFDLAEVETGEVFDASITYDKESNITTLEAIDTLTDQADVLAQLSEDEQSESQHTSESGIGVDGIVLIIIACIVVAIFAFFIFKNYRKTNKKSKELQRKTEETEVLHDNMEELRNKLIRGEINEDTYKEEQSKHSL